MASITVPKKFAKYVTASVAAKIDTSKEEHFTEWYKEVITKGDMIDYTGTQGSFVLKVYPTLHSIYFITVDESDSTQPTSCSIWSNIQTYLDEQIKSIGVHNFSFPLLPFDNREQLPDESIKTRITNRPTPESTIYPYFKKWITSHRDLPLRLNQWNTGFKWEPDSLPLLRDCEFLQQEAHTAHLTQDEAIDEIHKIINIYANLYRDVLAVPVFKGWKSRRNSKVDDIDNTVVMAFIPATGQCIEGATARNFGKKFSKKYEITVNDPSTKDDPVRLHAWQNSWTLSTKAIGLMIAIHGDNRGAIIPPRIAPVHMAIITETGMKFKEEEKAKAYEEIDSIVPSLRSVGVHATADLQGNSSAWNVYEWPITGVPLLMFIGKEEVTNETVTVYRRDLQRPDPGYKREVPVSEIATAIPAMLDSIQENLYQNTSAAFESRRRQIKDNWDEFIKAIIQDKMVCLAPHCLTDGCEEYVETTTTGDIELSSRIRCLCVPRDQPDEIELGITKCINPHCGNMSEKWAMFGYEF